MTPLEIEILLHYYYSPTDYRDIELHAIKSVVKKFVSLNLIFNNEITDPANPVYFKGNRDALQVYVDTLCAVPLPVNKWVMPDKD